MLLPAPLFSADWDLLLIGVPRNHQCVLSATMTISYKHSELKGESPEPQCWGKFPSTVATSA
jgi:hypothetical protein